MVRRTPPPAEPSKPMMPSPAPPLASAMVTWLPAVSDLAVSASTLAGTSAAADASVVPGSQVSSRWERRNRSVASSEMVSPSISIRTPVSTGSMSSRPAATTAWLTAAANTSLETVPAAAGISGRDGYSSTGMVCRLNRAEPQVSETLAPSMLISTGLLGRLRQMSASRRPDTSARPSSETSAGTVARAEVS